MFYKPDWFIQTENKLNKIWNAVYNNKISNFIKEFFMNIFGFGYDEYLYTDDLDSSQNYLRRLDKKYNTNNRLLRAIKMMFGKEEIFVEVGMTSSPDYALNLSGKSIFYKKRLLKDVTFFFNGDVKFIIKRICVYPTKNLPLDNN